MAIVSVGQAVPRHEDPELLRGDGRFTGDISLPNQSYGYMLRSPHAHARIKGIDTAAAAAATGVLLILTSADVEADGLGALPIMVPALPNIDPDKVFKPQRHALAIDAVRFVGDNIAFVVAETIAQAKDAAELIDVNYEVLPAITDTIQSADEAGPQIWEGCPDNLCFEHHFGDKEATDAAFAAADHVVKQRMTINRVAPSTMENRVTVADYDSAADRWTIHVPTQSAFGVRESLANKVFHEPEDKFHVITNKIGGSFGMKGLYPETICAVWASRKVGRPVRWENERSDSMVSDQAGRDKLVDAELALDKDGNFLGLRVHKLTNLGGYLGPMGLLHSNLNLSGMIGVYKTPVAYINTKGKFTNTCITGPYRGSGRPDACYVIERLIDIAARELGMDRAELRSKNLIPGAAMPYKTPVGATYDSGNFQALQKDALARIDYTNFETRRAEAKVRGRLRGIGIANNVENAAPPGAEYSTIRFAEDGSVTVISGTTDHGQGHATLYAQVVSERLGMDPERITVIEGDTDAQENGRGTGGSRVSSYGSNAAGNAAAGIIEKGKQIVSELLETAVVDIEFESGNFVVAGTDRSVSLDEVVQASFDPAKLPAGLEPGLSHYASYEGKVPNYPSGCHACEVEVDPETGKLEIVVYLAVSDVGRVINPLLVKGQIMGGIAQGAGQSMMESIHYDPESGQMQTGTFLDYPMPRAGDFCDVEIADHPTLTQTNLLGVKGVGEVGTASAMPVVVNAAMDALSPLGVRHLDMPLTPVKLWEAIQNARGKP